MGQKPNKYHISDEGIIYRINDDGSFTSVGNIDDIEKKQSVNTTVKTYPSTSNRKKSHNTENIGWWKRNYNWFWFATLVVFIGWFISCFSCAWPEYPMYDDENFIIGYYSADNTIKILTNVCLILLCYILSWILSTKKKYIILIIQLLVVFFASFCAYGIYCLCEPEYSNLLINLYSIPLIMWIIAIFINIKT